MTSLDWAADGRRFYIGSVPGLLLFADMDGRTDVLWRNESYPSMGTRGLPSPDSRHLAMEGWRTDNDIWMLENF